jgi:hypothetical protein
MWASREQVEQRLQAFIADFIDAMEEDVDGEIDLGTFAFVAEVKERRTPEELSDVLDSRRRPEVGYTPEAEWTGSLWYRCSDLREWVAAGLLRRAMKVADGDYDPVAEDQDPE